MKITLLHYKKIFTVYAGLLLLAGCVANEKVVVVSEKKIRMPEINENFKVKIDEIEKNEGAVKNVDNLLRLSFLYSHKLNPKPDYEKSLELMADYISKTPKDDQFEFAEYIRSLLETIERQKGYLNNQKRLLKNEKAEKRLLIDKNKNLQKKITSLKKLDIRLEKQRLGAE